MKQVLDPGLLNPTSIESVADRISRLTPASSPLWGKMNAGQMMAHCRLALEMALGDHKPPRMWMGIVLGPLLKSRMITRYALPKNSPAAPYMRMTDEKDFGLEQSKLLEVLTRFVGGEQAITRHPHTFLGKLTPQEWGSHAYFHLDYHLKQFGV